MGLRFLFVVMAVGLLGGCTRLPTTGRNVGVVLNYEPGTSLSSRSYPLRIAVKPFREDRGTKNKKMGFRELPIFYWWKTRIFERPDEYYKKTIIEHRSWYVKKGIIHPTFDPQVMQWRTIMPKLIARDLNASEAFASVEYTDGQYLRDQGFNAVLTGRIINSTEKEVSYVYGVGFLRGFLRLIPILPWGTYSQKLNIELTLQTFDDGAGSKVIWQGHIKEKKGPIFKCLFWHPWKNKHEHPYQWADALLRRGMDTTKDKILTRLQIQDKNFWNELLPYVKNGRAFIKKVHMPNFKGTPIVVAVDDIQAIGVGLEGRALAMSEHLRAVLLNTGRFDMINREDMKKIVEEINFQDTDFIDVKKIKTGKKLGVEKLIQARLSKNLDNYMMTIKVVDLNTFRNDVIHSKKLKCKEDQLFEFIDSAAKEMVLKLEGR